MLTSYLKTIPPIKVVFVKHNTQHPTLHWGHFCILLLLLILRQICLWENGKVSSLIFRYSGSFTLLCQTKAQPLPSRIPQFLMVVSNAANLTCYKLPPTPFPLSMSTFKEHEMLILAFLQQFQAKSCKSKKFDNYSSCKFVRDRF